MARDWLSTIADPTQRLLALLQLTTDLLVELKAIHANGETYWELRDETVLVQLPDGRGALKKKEASVDVHLTLDRAIYLAPEQTGALQRPIGPHTDLYSLGVFLYREISGTAPVLASNLNELMLGQMTKAVIGLRWRGHAVLRCVDEFVQRLLKREPRDRYTNAEAALSDLKRILDWMKGPRTESIVLGTTDRRERICEPSFVGRESWISRFIQCLSGEKAIVPRWIILSKSGDGKTRLLDEFSAEGMARNALVLRMKGMRSENSRPLESIASIGGDLEMQCQVNAEFFRSLKQAIAPHEESMRPLFPWLFDHEPCDTNVGPEKFAGQRLKRGIETLLDSLHQQPKRVLMLVDDLDELDELSYDLLIGWLNSKEVASLESLMFVATGSLRSRDQFQMDLGPIPEILSTLSTTHVFDLLASMIGEFPKDALELAASASNGNPFLAISLLQGMMESGGVQLRDGVWARRSGQPLVLQGCAQGSSTLTPRTVGLPNLVVQYLTAGAILGTSFRFAEAATLSKIDSILAQEALELSLQRQLVWSDGHQNQIGFVHEDVRQAFLQRLSEADRREMHLQAAALILREDPRRYYELAYHYDAAHCAEETVQFATLAAKHSQRQYANDLAIRYLRMAQKWLRPDDRDRRRETLESIGEVLVGTGEYDAAEAAFVEALRFADEAFHRTQLTGHIGDVEFKRGRLGHAAEQYVLALELSGVRIARNVPKMILGLAWQCMIQAKHSLLGLPKKRKIATPIQRLRWALFGRLAHIYWFSRGAVWTLFAHLSGMNEAECYIETPELAKCYSDHAPVCSLLQLFERGKDYGKRSLSIRCDQQDLWGQGQTLAYTSVVYLAAADFQNCIDVATQGIELLERTGDAWETNMALYQRANALYRAGRFREAATDAQRIHQSAVEIGDQQASGISLDIWIRTAPHKLSADIVIEQAKVLRTDAQSHAQTQLAYAILQMRAGQLESAVEILQGAIETCKRAGHLNTYISPCYAWLATTFRMIASSTPRFQVQLFQEQISQALKAAKRAYRIAHKFPADMPHVLRELALVHLLLGKPHAAATFFRQSIERARKLQSPMQEWESLSLLKELTAGLEDHRLRLTPLESIRLDSLAEMFSDSIRCIEGNATKQESLSLADRFDTLLADGRRITRSLEKQDIYREGCLAAQHLLRGQVIVIFAREPNESVWTVADKVSTVAISSLRLDRMAQNADFLDGAPADGQTRVMPWDGQDRIASGSLLVTPIRVRDSIVAYLVVGHTELENLFGNEELKVAEFIATLTGAALENAEGFSELHELNSTLEERVAERTAAAELRSAELIYSNKVLVETEEQLREAIEVANAASQSKSRFLATMSHEIRTPLNGILGMTQLALANSPSSQLTNYLSTIQRSGDSLLRLLNDLLDFSKIEAGKMTVEMTSFDPLSVCSDAIGLLSISAFQKGIEVAVYYSPAVPRILVGDPMKLRQVVLNLLGNAIKFTSKGSVEIRVEIQLGEPNQLAIRVIDTGIGIPQDKQQSIFESFSQADNSTTRRFGGTGLGLAISSELVHLMDGRIEVKSQADVGSEFTVLLPMQIDPCAEQQNARNGTLLGKKFLILDPCEAARRCLEDTLTDCGGFALSFDSWSDKPSEETPDLEYFDAVIAAGPEASELVSHADRLGIANWLSLGPDAMQKPNQNHLIKPILRDDWIHTLATTIANRCDAHLRIEQEPNSSDLLAATDKCELQSKRSLNILVAEDGLVNQCVLVGLLELAGHRAMVANDGREAVDLVQRNAFDVCLMDLDMPELDGIQATVQIRKLGIALPIFAMTAHHDQDHADKSKAAGMTGFLTKPINPKDLERILDQIASESVEAFAPR